MHRLRGLRTRLSHGDPLVYLTQKLNQEVNELFQFETGLDSDKLPPLSTYDVDDKQEFIK